MSWNPLPQLRGDIIVRVVHPNVVRPNRVNVLPAPEASRLEDTVHVVEGKVDLAADVVWVNLAADCPSALPRALDGIAENDGLGVVTDVAELLTGASVVVILQGGHDWASASSEAGCILERSVIGLECTKACCLSARSLVVSMKRCDSE